MAVKDLASRISSVQAIGAATLAASNTPAAIDLDGFHSATVLLSVGAGGITFDPTNRIDFVLTESDGDVTYSNVDITKVSGAGVSGLTSISSGIVKSLIAAHASADVTEIGYIGGKRYLKLLAQSGGTHSTGTPVSAIVVKGNPVVIPAA
jgi:hypothetical protein